MHKLLVLLVGLMAVGVGVGAQPSEAAYPRVNAEIAFPVWSDDGSKIVFGGLDAHVVNGDGSGPNNLATNAVGYGKPVWSPDGSKIAFHRVPGANLDVYVVDADGKSQANLTTNWASDMYRVVSPNGSRIAFSSMRTVPTLNSCPCSHEIFVMSANGSGAVRLTQAIEPMWDELPDWAPDGPEIAPYGTRDDFTYEVYEMKAAGSWETNLTNNPAVASHPAWPPAGSDIVFLSTRDSGKQIFVMNAYGSGQMEQTDAGGTHPDWQPSPPGVGGIAELPEVAEAPMEAGGSSGPGVAAVVATATTAALALGGAGWYTRRRSSR